jgi:hypothetical protein
MSQRIELWTLYLPVKHIVVIGKSFLSERDYINPWSTYISLVNVSGKNIARQ